MHENKILEIKEASNGKKRGKNLLSCFSLCICHWTVGASFDFCCHLQCTVIFLFLIFFSPTVKRKRSLIKVSSPNPQIFLYQMCTTGFGWWWCAGRLLLLQAGKRNPESSHHESSLWFLWQDWVFFFSPEVALILHQNHQQVFTFCSFNLSPSEFVLYSLGTIQTAWSWILFIFFSFSFFPAASHIPGGCVGATCCFVPTQADIRLHLISSSTGRIPAARSALFEYLSSGSRTHLLCRCSV